MTPETREKVIHNYSDHALEPDPEPQAGKEGQAVAGLDHNFPMKLHYMLSNTQDQSHVISWMPHGRCFMVHDMKEFVSSMLPLWFRQSKFASFQRQLNLYGFQRLTQGRDKNAYYHEYFLRGRPLLATKINRTKVKGKGARKASSPETEPRLYDYPWMEVTRMPTTNPRIAVQPTATTNMSATNPSQRVSPTLAVLANLAPNPVTPPSVTTSAFSVPLAPQHSSLEGALGFLSTLSQVHSGMSVPSQVTAVLPGGEPMFLPSTSNNPNSLNTLLTSFDPAQTESGRNGALASRYVPIAPAPPSHGGEPIKPRLEAANNYASVLAALKVQHHMAEVGQAPTQTFTNPGPAP